MQLNIKARTLDRLRTAKPYEPTPPGYVCDMTEINGLLQNAMATVPRTFNMQQHMTGAVGVTTTNNTAVEIYYGSPDYQPDPAAYAERARCEQRKLRREANLFALIVITVYIAGAAILYAKYQKPSALRPAQNQKGNLPGAVAYHGRNGNEDGGDVESAHPGNFSGQGPAGILPRARKL